MFTTQKLVNHRVVVSGTDNHGNFGTEVLDSTQWDAIVDATTHDALHEAFDAKVEEFFAPLTEAAEAIAQAHIETPDPATTLVIDEGEEGTAGRPAQIIHLGREAAILRLIEAGDVDRLIWVGDHLEILAAPDTLDFEEPEQSLDVDFGDDFEV